MQYVANGVMAVGLDAFVSKKGETMYSVMFANGKGQPHKVSVTPEQYALVQHNAMNTLYDIEVNVNTVGYNAFADLVSIELQ